MFNSIGWLLLGLTWWWMFEHVWGTEISCKDREEVIAESCPTLPEDRYIVTTFEKNLCKTDTNETVVWKTVEKVKVDVEN